MAEIIIMIIMMHNAIHFERHKSIAISIYAILKEYSNYSNYPFHTIFPSHIATYAKYIAQIFYPRPPHVTPLNHIM